MWAIALKSFEWTFVIKKPIRRYQTPKEGESLKERALTPANIVFDAADLLFNHRGLGWSWSSDPFPHNPSPPPSISTQFLKLLLKITAFDAAHYVVQLICPSTYRPEGDTVFDKTLDLLPSLLQASCIPFGMIFIYASVDIIARSSVRACSVSSRRNSRASRNGPGWPRPCPNGTHVSSAAART
jgi:hypothetical protein